MRQDPYAFHTPAKPEDEEFYGEMDRAIERVDMARYFVLTATSYLFAIGLATLLGLLLAGWRP